MISFKTRFFGVESQDQLMDIYQRLDEMGADTAATKAGYILHGLGFTKEMQQKKCKDFSGEYFNTQHLPTYFDQMAHRLFRFRWLENANSIVSRFVHSSPSAPA